MCVNTQPNISWLDGANKDDLLRLRQWANIKTQKLIDEVLMSIYLAEARRKRQKQLTRPSTSNQPNLF